MPNESIIEFHLHPRRRTAGHNESATGLPQTGCLPRITQVIALALSFQQMLRTGEATSYAAIARTASITPERFSQVMKLLWLAPDIQQEILELPPGAGRYPLSEHSLRHVARHLLWADQRRDWCELKRSLRLA
jgi:hypothetical protein